MRHAVARLSPVCLARVATLASLPAAPATARSRSTARSTDCTREEALLAAPAGPDTSVATANLLTPARPTIMPPLTDGSVRFGEVARRGSSGREPLALVRRRRL